MTDLKEKKYEWPEIEMANGSGGPTGAYKLIALSIKTLGQIVHDLAIVIQEATARPATDRNMTPPPKQDDDSPF